MNITVKNIVTSRTVGRDVIRHALLLRTENCKVFNKFIKFNSYTKKMNS